MSIRNLLQFDKLSRYAFYPEQVYHVNIACPTANCSQCNNIACQTCSAGFLLYSNDGNCYSNTTGPIGTYANDEYYIGKIFTLFSFVNQSLRLLYVTL